MEQTLRIVEDVLRAYGRVYQANLAMIAGGRFSRAPHEACRLLNNDDWWGGRDSIAALDCAVEGGYSTGAREDARRLRAALVEIYGVMKAFGEVNENAELLASQFRKWVVSGV